MNIEKAIDIKTRKGNEVPYPSFTEMVEADRLSIEALKAVKHQRQDRKSYSIPFLPGETD